MSGPHRNPDKLNSIGIVVVGICGAVLVYVSIVALQAFYMNDSSTIQHMADYGGQDTTHRTLRAQQLENLQRYEPKPPPQPGTDGRATPPQTYSIAIDDAIPLVVEAAKRDPSNLVPAIGPAVKATVEPVFGRPRPLNAAGTAGAAGTGGTAGGGTDATGAAGATPGSTGTGAEPTPGTAPTTDGPGGTGGGMRMTPTGGQGPGGGAPPGQEGQRLQDPSGAATKANPAPRANPSPKADPGPSSPKVDAPKAAPAQPKK
jgi:hypothetical protein